MQDREYIIFNKLLLYFQNDNFFSNIVSGVKRPQGAVAITSYSILNIKSFVFFLHQINSIWLVE